MSFNSKLGDYIMIAENVISHDLCDRILQEYSDQEYIPAGIGSGRTDTKSRKVKFVGMSEDRVISVNKDGRSDLDTEVFNASAAAIEAYHAKHDQFRPNSDTGYDLLRYQIGDYYTEHTDSGENFPRSLSCSFALNEDYEGGEFAFFGRELTIKAPKGAAVMFPSNFMYPHEIMPVTSGTRYSIITWFI